jgi:hydrogenase expression/formation protein HypE
MEIEVDKILLAHGSGGKLSHELLSKYLLPGLSNPILDKMDDSAVINLSQRCAFTTDSFVVNPLFFPGGDIGKLSICGTVNDLSMCGAKPLYLSLALIIEEGMPLDDLERIMVSINQTVKAAGVKIVTGDTKVVNRGNSDKLFINTAGIGIIPVNVNISGSNAKVGDLIILNGTLGDHGIAVIAQRESLRFKIPVESDCAPLNSLVAEMLTFPEAIHSLRDPTRGGLASTLNEISSQSQVGMTIYEDKIPVKSSVKAACEMLGFDPLYVANEGKLVAIVAREKAEEIVQLMQNNQYGRDSVIIGEVTDTHPGRVIMKTCLGTSRIIDMLSGELLPRIC